MFFFIKFNKKKQNSQLFRLKFFYVIMFLSKKIFMIKKTKVAYFSMEIAIDNKIKSFAGGLGVLAGDILRAASEEEFPMLAVTLLNKNGYFKQVIDKKGKQLSKKDKSDYSKLKLLPHKIYIKISNDKVLLRAWEYLLKSEEGIVIPVYLLDTDWPENREKHRRLCENLYDSDLRKKLKQSIVLGRGGVKLLNKIGQENILKIHLNEGHGALAAIQLFLDSKKKSDDEKIKEVRKKIVFTTHTPVVAGHDVYFSEFLLKYQPDFPVRLKNLIKEDKINFSNLAMFFSSYINGVSLKHREVSRKMFPNYKINSITNGISSSFWTTEEFKNLFDNFIPGWRKNNCLLSEAEKIPLDLIKEKHLKAKRRLLSFINKTQKKDFQENVFTICFARRFAAYKRPTLLLKDIKELKKINKDCGKIQIIYAGKAHPQDVVGKTLISEVNKKIKQIESKIKIVFLPNYDLDMAKLLVSGVDLWLNNPVPPNEASATSGMKAAHNAIPQISTWDGWWIEASHKRKTGWTIKEDGVDNNLYKLLAEEILPLYYNNQSEYLKISRQAISQNASKFNTQRVVREYIKNAYKD